MKNSKISQTHTHTDRQTHTQSDFLGFLSKPKSDLNFGPEDKLFWGKLQIHKLRTRLSVHFTAKFFQEKYQFLEFYIGVT